jgi:GT2 family glycosyltransferase
MPPDRDGVPDVSFLIGHRGRDRLPLLLATLQSIAAQRTAAFECVVVEQDAVDTIRTLLPPWVRYVHTPPIDPNMPYCRSWALNVAAAHARSRVLVLQDNDMLVPEDYACSLLRFVDEGYEAVNLKRFVFYLSRLHSTAYSSGTATLGDFAPEFVVQNLEAGGSVAITRDAFERIGGMDEAFIGWGGEDNEFWERAQTLRVWPYGYLPLVHLWHPPQPYKDASDNPMLRRHRELASVAPEQRIARLLRIERGLHRGPAASPRTQS